MVLSENSKEQRVGKTGGTVRVHSCSPMLNTGPEGRSGRTHKKEMLADSGGSTRCLEETGGKLIFEYSWNFEIRECITY